MYNLNTCNSQHWPFSHTESLTQQLSQQRSPMSPFMTQHLRHKSSCGHFTKQCTRNYFETKKNTGSSVQSWKSDITVHNFILTQHLKLEGNLENPSTSEKTRMHSKELFQKNPTCFPQKFFLYKSRDTVPNPAVDKDIGLLFEAGLSCRSRPMAAVPGALSRAAAPWPSCTLGLGLQSPTSMRFCLQGSLSLIVTYKPERSRANWIHRAPKPAHSADMSFINLNMWTF